MIQVIAIFLPLAWGWSWHNISDDNKSWSMAADGGVMPLSQYWTAKLPAYRVGDIVSFQYRGGSSAEENGGSIKAVTDVSPGYLYVRGLNPINSIPPCWVPLTDVNGKIVAGPISLAPSAFWHWLTLGWSLEYDGIRVRKEKIFSREFASRCFSAGGWFLNGLTLHEDTRRLIYADPGSKTWAKAETLRVQINGTPSSLIHIGGETGDPILANPELTAAWKFSRGKLVPYLLTANDKVRLPFDPSSTAYQQFKNASMIVTCAALPSSIMRVELAAVCDGNPKSFWKGVSGLNAVLQIQFPRNVRKVTVVQNGIPGPGDVVFDVGDQSGWRATNPPLNFNPGAESIPRVVESEKPFNRLRISNSMGTEWRIYEVSL
ncbi:MAG: hypothetical protein WCG99_02415 [Candidatus Berkelbacteria bacterium]